MKLLIARVIPGIINYCVLGETAGRALIDPPRIASVGGVHFTVGAIQLNEASGQYFTTINGAPYTAGMLVDIGDG